MLHEDYYNKCSFERKPGRESQGAWRQDELIDGTPQVWDIRQPVSTLAEETVRISYQETTIEDIEYLMRASGTVRLL
jgi:hypothetical protein